MDCRVDFQVYAREQHSQKYQPRFLYYSMQHVLFSCIEVIVHVRKIYGSSSDKKCKSQLINYR